jgi:hypothetical protein
LCGYTGSTPRALDYGLLRSGINRPFYRINLLFALFNEKSHRLIIILSQLASDPQNSLNDDFAGMEDRHALRNAVIPGQTLIYVITQILTIPPPWNAVETHEHDQRDIDA